MWSVANLAGTHLPDFCAPHGLACDPETIYDIFQRTREAASQIIKRKGATYYTVVADPMRVVEAILRDLSTVLSVSSLIEGYRITDESLDIRRDFLTE